VDGSVHHSGSTPETLTELVLAQVRLLRALLATIADLDRALAAGLVGHATAKLLAPMPRIGEVNLVQIVAEVGPILERVDTAEQAIAECGAAPVTRASGKTKTWVPLGRQAVCRCPRARQAPPHAIRILARAWLRVIWACWHTDTAYNPARHRAEQRLTA
jgi:transposase